MKHRISVEINLENLVCNYKKIAARVKPAKVLAVLKSNAYGMGMAPFAKALAEAGCRDFGVADPFEALELKKILRSIGVKAKLQIMSAILPDEIESLIRAGAVLPICDFKTAKAVSEKARKLKRKAKINFKIDTGMGRLGISADEAIETMLRVSRLENIEVDGILSHCPVADQAANDFTKKQISRFRDIVLRAAQSGIKFNNAHIAASDAIVNYPESFAEPFNMVRTGLNLHGAFNEASSAELKLKPVMTLKSRIVQVRLMPPLSTVGYAQTWTAHSPTKIALVACGYADGLPLALSNRGKVIVKGSFCPIVGRISMDYTAVDVTGVKAVKAGDEVILIGSTSKASIGPEDWANLKGTHVYDIICSLGERVERKVMKGGKAK